MSRVSPSVTCWKKPACVICRCVGQQRSFVHFNFSRFFHFFSACFQSDGGRQSGVFAEVVPGRCVWRNPRKWAVWGVLGKRAAQGGEGGRAEGGKATVCDAGAVQSLGRAAVPQIHQHWPESLLHPRHAEVRRRSKTAALSLTPLIIMGVFLCLLVVPGQTQPPTSFSDRGSWTLSWGPKEVQRRWISSVTSTTPRPTWACASSPTRTMTGSACTYSDTYRQEQTFRHIQNLSMKPPPRPSSGAHKANTTSWIWIWSKTNICV